MQLNPNRSYLLPDSTTILIKREVRTDEIGLHRLDNILLYFKEGVLGITQQDLLFEMVGCRFGLDVAHTALVTSKTIVHVLLPAILALFYKISTPVW